MNPDKWEQSTAEETNTYIRHLAEFGEMQHDSLLDEDEWTRCTGIDSGEWFGTDCPFDVYEV